MGTAIKATDCRSGGSESMTSQGLGKATPRRREIVEIRSPGNHDRGRWLQDRIVALIRAGLPRFTEDDRAKVWWHRPGALPWWEVRQRIGGRIRTEVFAEAIENLLAEGSLIEVWTKMLGARPDGHILMLPGHSDALRWPVVRARALREVLEQESWAQRLASR